MHALSLVELNQTIKSALSNQLEPSYWVVAEIADIKINQKGHCYLELVQKSEFDVLAKNRGTIWAYEFRNIHQRFTQTTGRELVKGMKILFNTVISYHEIYGLSLNIRDIDPQYTVGERALKKKQTIEKLRKEGLLDKNKSLSLPPVPQNVAIISSPTAAGYGDFMDQLEKNGYGYKFSARLFKAIMQGDTAVDSIILALDKISNALEDYQVVILIRGGGSQVDLDSFDNYELCKAVANCRFPVITGIGHERDESVVDMVAHTQLKTPTAVGEFLINGFMHFEAVLNDFLYKIRYEYNQTLHNQMSLLNQTKSNIYSRFKERMKSEEFKHHVILNNLKSGISQLINIRGFEINSLKDKIEALNPSEILKKGYTLSSIDGVILKDVSQIEPGMMIKTETLNHKIKSEIKVVDGKGD